LGEDFSWYRKLGLSFLQLHHGILQLFFILSITATNRHGVLASFYTFISFRLLQDTLWMLNGASGVHSLYTIILLLPVTLDHSFPRHLVHYTLALLDDEDERLAYTYFLCG